MAGHEVSVIGSSATAIGIGALMMDRYDLEPTPILLNDQEPTFDERTRQLASDYGMPIHDAAIVEVLGDKSSGLEGYRLADGTTVRTPKSIVALGIIAYNELLTSLGGEVDASGKAVVGDKYESSVPGLFVAGDLVAGKKMQIYTGWDVAVDAADEINRRLRSERRKQRLQ